MRTSVVLLEFCGNHALRVFAVLHTSTAHVLLRNVLESGLGIEELQLLLDSGTNLPVEFFTKKKTGAHTQT